MTDSPTIEPRQHVLEAHQVTLDEFRKGASVEELQNHGRKWRVAYDNGRNVSRFETFSDAATIEDAIADAHYTAVNNALYSIETDKVSWGYTTPQMPPVAVLNEYPELVEEYGLDMGRMGDMIAAFNQGLAQRQMQHAAELGADAFLHGGGSEPTDDTELGDLIARRAGCERPPHEAPTSELAKAYTEA